MELLLKRIQHLDQLVINLVAMFLMRICYSVRIFYDVSVRTLWNFAQSVHSVHNLEKRRKLNEINIPGE